MMKLYYHPLSVNARKSRLAAALLNLELDLRFVDVSSGEHKKPEYLALNPNGRVPTLEDNGFVLWESNAIAQYFASKRATPDLFPSDRKVRADVSRWQFWDAAHWSPATQTLSFECMYKKLAGLGAPDGAVVEKGTKDFHQLASVLNRHLEGREHLVGKSITLADLSLAAGLTYAVPAGMPVDGYKHIQRWFASVETLDAWKKTAPQAMG